MAKTNEPEAPPSAAPVDIFERQKLKASLTNRVFRALKEATDDEMRKQIIAEVASLTKLIQ